MIRLGQLAEIIGATCVGDQEVTIDSVADLKVARPGQVSFLTSQQYLPYLADTKASAVITSKALAADQPGNFLIMDNPYLGFALAAQHFDTTPKPAHGIHPTAQIADDVILGDNVSIGAYSVIEAGCNIGDNSCIGPQVFIGRDSSLGADCLIYPQVAIYHNVRIGNSAILHSGCVLGSDGFGFANDKGNWIKIPQLGGITIGDNFEAGANTTIDRGALVDTIIGDGVILDNLVHIAHNVSIGDNSAMAAMTGIAGGAQIGKGVTLAGRVGIIGHLVIADNVHVTVNSLVSKSLTEAGVYSSGDVVQNNRDWKRKVSRMRQLDKLFNRVKNLELELKQLKENKEQNND
jgi:UDP-3-O-[3-hydroxymyristoyl] glucosamine N-acyltransferase